MLYAVNLMKCRIYIGTSTVHSVDFKSEISRVPQEVYVSKPITTNEKGVSAPKSKEVEPSCVTHIKTPRQPIKDQETPKVNRKNWNAMMERELGEGYSFIKKKCFVCGSLSHLIKDCDYYEKKMAREAAPKKQRVFNTGNGVTKPVWNNADRINHANHFVPRSVILNSGRPNVNSVRPNVNTVRTNINSVRQNVNSVWSNVNTGSFNVNSVRPKQPVPTSTSPNFSSERPQVNKFNQRSNFSKSHSSVRRPFAKNTAQMSHSHAVKGNWGSAVKTSAGYNWRPTRPNSNCNGGPTFIRTDHPLKNMVDRGIFDSGCSGHMTGNKDQLEDFEEFNGGSVTFGGSKGYITGKGRIRVGNLDFDSVSFVKELGHFNLFSISQICDKQHKTPTPAKGFACLIAKATSDESKLWHRRCLEEVTNSAGTSQTLISNASKEKDKDVELIVVPSTVRNTEEKVESRKYSTNLKKEEILTEHQQEKKASSTNTSEDNPKILAFRRVNTGSFDPDDSPMPELEIFHKSETRIFNEASYDEEGVITDFHSLPTKIEVNPTPTLRSNIHPKKSNLDDSWVQAMQEDLLQAATSMGSCRSTSRNEGMKRFMSHKPPGICDPDHPRRDKKDIMWFKCMLCCDIIFGLPKSLCDEFEALDENQISMSCYGDLTLFCKISSPSVLELKQA
ncbi:hypothetical protein Tco_0475292 [Tanacetum coccineum]